MPARDKSTQLFPTDQWFDLLTVEQQAELAAASRKARPNARQRAEFAKLRQAFKEACCQ
jgi:hypothetical protein